MKKRPFLNLELMRRVFSDEYLILKNKPAIIPCNKQFYNVTEVAQLVSANWKAWQLLFFMRKANIIRRNGLPYKNFNKYGVIAGSKLGMDDFDTVFTEAGVAYIKDRYHNRTFDWGLLS